MALRIGFVTGVRLGLECLEEIYRIGAEIHLGVTLADTSAPGRSGAVSLDAPADRLGFPLLKVRNINDDDSVGAIERAGLDWLFIIGWSQIARHRVLAAARHGCMGIHPTPLPVGRGRAPIPWTIINGLDEAGVTLFRLDEGVDSGPIAHQVRFPVRPREDATTLYDRVADAHRELMRLAIPAMVDGSIVFTPQDEHLATYWPQRRPEDGRLDPAMTVEEADRLVRGVTRPYPGAFVDTVHGVMTIWKAHPHDGQWEPGHPAAPLLDFSDGALVVDEWEPRAF